MTRRRDGRDGPQVPRPSDSPGTSATTIQPAIETNRTD
jgi:hypothetical protein